MKNDEIRNDQVSFFCITLRSRRPLRFVLTDSQLFLKTQRARRSQSYKLRDSDRLPLIRHSSLCGLLYGFYSADSKIFSISSTVTGRGFTRKMRLIPNAFSA